MSSAKGLKAAKLRKHWCACLASGEHAPEEQVERDFGAPRVRAMFFMLALATVTSRVYGQVAIPVFTPPSGTRLPVTVTITDSTPGSQIYFTVDSSVPTNTSSLYTGPLALTNYLSLRARAFVSGQGWSDTASAEYLSWSDPPAVSYQRDILNLSNGPSINVAIAGAYNVSCFTIEEKLIGNIQPASITAGGVFIASNNAIRWGPFTNVAATGVTYRVVGPAGTYLLDGSASADGAWTFRPPMMPVTISSVESGGVPTPPPQVATPAFTPASGSNVPVSVTISCATPGATTYLTLDGSLPTQSSMLYTGALSLVSAGVVRARAFTNGWTPSVASVAYYGPPLSLTSAQVTRGVSTNSPTSPTISLSAVLGTNAACFALEDRLAPGLSASNVSAGGVYLPSNNVVRWGPFLGSNTQVMTYQAMGLPGSYPVRAVWSVDGVGGGEVAGTNVLIASAVGNGIPTPLPQVATPAFTPASGSNVPVSVTISCATLGAAIYVTLDGSFPTQSSMSYTGALSLVSASVVRARAFTNGWTPSIASVAYYGPEMTPPAVQVTRSVTTNSPASPVITLSAALGTNVNCFALEDRLAPGLSASNITAGGVYLSSNNVVRWGPFLGTNAQVMTYQATGPAGSYPVRAAWSVDGVGGMEVTGMNVLIASTAGNGTPNPPPRVPTPVLSPAVSSNLPVTVSISCSDPQAQIYFTTDGSLPTQNSSPYINPLTFNVQTSLRARGFRAGYLSSVAVLGEYVPALSTNSLLLSRTVFANGTVLPSITITAAPQGTVRCYSVTESVAPGLTVSGLGAGALWNPTDRTLRWGPFLDGQTRLLTYNLNGASGTYPLAGMGSFDGYPIPVTGAATATINMGFSGWPDTNYTACAGQPFVYGVNIDPSPGLITVDSANGTLDWGDTNQVAITAPLMTFQHTYSTTGYYTLTVSADWTGHTTNSIVSGHATKSDIIRVVTECYAPTIVTQPSNQVVLAGTTAEFNVAAISSFPMAYQWLFNQTNAIAGATTPALTLYYVTPSEAGQFSVIVTNAYGGVTSSVARLTVVTPLITNVMRNVNGSVTLTFVGLPDSTSRIWAATNLGPPVIWQPLSTNGNLGPSGVWQFTDTNAVTLPVRFYRFSTP